MGAQVIDVKILFGVDGGEEDEQRHRDERLGGGMEGREGKEGGRAAGGHRILAATTHFRAPSPPRQTIEQQVAENLRAADKQDIEPRKRHHQSPS